MNNVKGNKNKEEIIYVKVRLDKEEWLDFREIYHGIGGCKNASQRLRELIKKDLKRKR